MPGKVSKKARARAKALYAKMTPAQRKKMGSRTRELVGQTTLSVRREAEEKHQSFYRRNTMQPYCMFVVRPKVPFGD